MPLQVSGGSTTLTVSLKKAAELNKAAESDTEQKDHSGTVAKKVTTTSPTNSGNLTTGNTTKSAATNVWF